MGLIAMPESEPALPVTYLDTTLRDGSHALDHDVSPDLVRAVVTGLAAAGVRYVEVGHGAGLGGSSLLQGLGSHENEALFDAACEVAGDSQLVVLLVPGIGVMDELRAAVDHGIQGVRVAVHVTEADVGLQHVELGRDLGLKTFGFLMMAHMAAPDVIVEQAKMMVDSGAEVVYLADSAGNMTENEVIARFDAIRSRIDVPLGFHGHNNLGLAVANSLSAVRSGATWIDGALAGLGAGAGNLQGEVFAVVAERYGLKTALSANILMDSANDHVQPVMRAPQIIDRTSLIIGQAGVYSSFLHKAEKAAARYNLDPRDVLLEAGRRRAVGGQEDLLEKIALELSEGLSPAAT
jgi:4-hydroxy 2-oxovalerate aldolase